MVTGKELADAFRNLTWPKYWEEGERGYVRDWFSGSTETMGSSSGTAGGSDMSSETVCIVSSSGVWTGGMDSVSVSG